MANVSAQLKAMLQRAKDADGELGDALLRYERDLATRLSNINSRHIQVARVYRYLQWSGYEVTDRKLQDFLIDLAEKQVSVEARRGIQRSLRHFVEFLWLEGHPGKNTEDAVVPRVLDGKKYKLKGAKTELTREDLLTDDELQALIDATGSARDRAMIAVLWDSGARPNEVMTMRWEGVHTHPVYGQAFSVTICIASVIPPFVGFTVCIACIWDFCQWLAYGALGCFALALRCD